MFMLGAADTEHTATKSKCFVYSQKCCILFLQN